MRSRRTRKNMAETLEDLIGTIRFPLICLRIIISAFIRKLNYLLDKATDPSKSREGVDYTTPVCDRINLELDG